MLTRAVSDHPLSRVTSIALLLPSAEAKKAYSPAPSHSIFTHSFSK